LLVPGVILIIAADIEHKLSKDVLTTRETENRKVFPDLDHGIEWCENQVLSQMAGS